MAEVKVHCSQIEVRSGIGVDIRDVTAEFHTVLRESGVKEGQLTANVVGSTGSLTTIEFEPGVVSDLARAVNELAEPGREYAHELAWHDGNGHSHVQAALVGPSIALSVRSGELALGTWQQVVAVNHDNKPRTRRVAITVIGV